MKYILLFISFYVFAQQTVNLFPVYGQPQARRISMEKVILQIRELKTQSSIKYGDAVDFYFKKIISSGKNQWVEKLEEFSLDPECPAKNKVKINEIIQRLRTLQIGEKAPNILTQNFNLHQHKSETKSLLLLFYSPSCFHCTELLVDLIPYSEKVKLPVIAIQIDEELNHWAFPLHWKSIKANEKVRKEYGILSTPSLFLIQRNSMRINAIPENMSEIKKSEHLF
jgi:thioredoxin-related protein